MTQYGPFPVSKGEVFTNIIAQGGDTLDIKALGWVSFARVVGRTFSADGDDWSTPSDFPAPFLRKHSLIVKFGSGPWFQGGKSQLITVPPTQSGEVILRTNDHNDWLWDNDNFWSVFIDLTRPSPPPAPAGPTNPELHITSVEVVQAIQRTSNSVPLVQGKRTIVRVFVDSGLRNGQNVGVGTNRWPGVTGSLRISDAINGMPLATVSTPLNVGGEITAMAASDINREQWNHSLNFELPLNILDRSLIDIEALIQTPLSTPHSGGKATQSVRLRFHQRSRQPLLPVLVRLSNPAIAAPAPTMSNFTNLLVTGALPRYPVSETGFVVRPPFFWETTQDLREPNDWNGLMQQLATIKLLSSNPVDGIRCALIPITAKDGMFGLGAPHIWGSWVPSFIIDASNSLADRGFAHEMGHTFGVWHSDCTGSEGMYDRRDMPGLIDDVGVNVRTRTIIPRLSPDIVSYCWASNQWCSVQFYQAIFEEGVI